MTNDALDIEIFNELQERTLPEIQTAGEVTFENIRVVGGVISIDVCLTKKVVPSNDFRTRIKNAIERKLNDHGIESKNFSISEDNINFVFPPQ